MCGGFVGDTLASIDPGPAIGEGLSEVDKFVNREVPGGWALPATIAAAYATGYVDPSLFSSEYGTQVVTEQGQNAFFEALANGASSEEALKVGSAIDTLLSTAAGKELTDLSAQELTDFAKSVENDPSFVKNASGNFVQTLDDGSTITLDANGNPISATDAPSDPINWKNVVNNPVAKTVGSSLAKTALNTLLGSATKNLMGSKGFKPVGQGGLSMTDATGDLRTGMELTPGLTSSSPNYSLDVVSKVNPELYGVPTNTALNSLNPQQPQPQPQPQPFAAGGYAMGGEYQEHNPSFYSEGGMENRYVKGDGDGTSDDVAAMLANGEFVIPADVVAALGNGSNDAGAHVLDQFLSVVREDNHSNEPDELPPESKGPLDYLAQARKRA